MPANPGSQLRALLAEQDTGWHEQAACRGADPDLFFPYGNSGAALEQAEQAKAICAGCMVRAECLDYAVATRQDGIWGGTDEGERVLIRAGLRQRAEVSA